jgi:predicted Co/Zn/Cd cation transporter (cation efflux family)
MPHPEAARPETAHPEVANLDRGRPRRQLTTAVDGAIALIVVLLLVQMWLLSAALESLLAGHREAALPAALASGVLFAGCLALYLFLRGLDRQGRGR